MARLTRVIRKFLSSTVIKSGTLSNVRSHSTFARTIASSVFLRSVMSRTIPTRADGCPEASWMTAPDISHGSRVPSFLTSVYSTVRERPSTKDCRRSAESWSSDSGAITSSGPLPTISPALSYPQSTAARCEAKMTRPSRSVIMMASGEVSTSVRYLCSLSRSSAVRWVTIASSSSCARLSASWACFWSSISTAVPNQPVTSPRSFLVGSASQMPAVGAIGRAPQAIFRFVELSATKRLLNALAGRLAVVRVHRLHPPEALRLFERLAGIVEPTAVGRQPHAVCIRVPYQMWNRLGQKAISLATFQRSLLPRLKRPLRRADKARLERDIPCSILARTTKNRKWHHGRSARQNSMNPSVATAYYSVHEAETQRVRRTGDAPS